MDPVTLAIAKKQLVVKGSLAFNVVDYGADPTGAVDSTTAIQAAIAAVPTNGGEVFFPCGTYTTNAPITLKTNLTVSGPSYGNSAKIINTTTGIFVSTGSLSLVTVQNLYLIASAGHIFDGASYSFMQLRRCRLAQLADGFSVVNITTGMVDSILEELRVDHTLTATVPTMKFSANNNVNSNSFQRIRFTNSGDYSIHIESTGSAYAYNNSIRDINFEVTTGGAIRLLSVFGTLVEQCTVWDLVNSGGPSLKDLFYVGRYSTTGPSSRNTTFKHIYRAAGSLGSGLADIKLQTSYASGTVIQDCESATLTGYVVDLSGNANCVVIGNKTDPINTAATTILIRNGDVTIGGNSLSPSNTTVYDTPGTFTWTKPVAGTMVRVYGVAAGGGGGSGRRGAAGSLRQGGGGGAGGGLINVQLPMSDMSTTEPVVVGSPGTGGAAVTADDTDGNPGTNATATYFKSSTISRNNGALTAGGEAGLGSGTPVAATAGPGSGGTSQNGGAGGAASATGGAGGTGGTSSYGGSGGGAGSGITTGNAVANGGSGNNLNGLTAGAGGTSPGGSGAQPASATLANLKHQAGPGSGGGASSITGVAGSGAAGSGYGAGGGGGGASLNGNNSGAGGDGGPAFIIVTVT